MFRIFVFGLWCSISVFSKTEFRFIMPSPQIGEWLAQAEFPALYLTLDEKETLPES